MSGQDDGFVCPDCGSDKFELRLGGCHSGKISCAGCGLVFQTPAGVW